MPALAAPASAPKRDARSVLVRFVPGTSPQQMRDAIMAAGGTGAVNRTTPLDPANTAPLYDGTPCPTADCHLKPSASPTRTEPASSMARPAWRAATGKQVVGAGANIYRLVDGKIVESWQLLDVAGLLRQLDAA